MIHLVKQAGEREGYNLFISGDIGVPIMLRFEKVRNGLVEDIRVSSVVVQNKSAILNRMNEMIENNEAVDFEDSICKSFSRKGSTQINISIPEHRRYHGKIEEVDFG